MKIVSQENIHQVAENLKRNEMEALYITTAQDAKEEVLKRIPLDATIGIDGSVTIREMGLLEV
jgi:hypothetical protein